MYSAQLHIHLVLVATLGEIKAATQILGRLASMGYRISRTIDPANSIADSINLASSILRLSSSGLISQGASLLQRTANQDTGFLSVLPTGSQFNDAILALQANSAKFLTSIISNFKHPRFINAIDSLKGSNAQLLVFMPTPEIGPNPLLTVPTGIRLKAGVFNPKVHLYFGHKGMTGRFIGVGSSDSSRTEVRKPHQFFRMDWHSPHTNRKGSELEYWNAGIGNFHFHILSKRK